MKKKFAIVILAIAAAFAANAAAQTSAVKSSSQPGKTSVEQTVDVTATIIAIDRTTRDITLKGPQGNWIVVTAGPEVKNFDQINVGDKVHARYIEVLVLELKHGDGLAVVRTDVGFGQGRGAGSAAARRRRPSYHRRCRCRRRQPRNADCHAAGTATHFRREGCRSQTAQADPKGRSDVWRLQAGARDGGGGDSEEIVARRTALPCWRYRLCGSGALEWTALWLSEVGIVIVVAGLDPLGAAGELRVHPDDISVTSVVSLIARSCSRLPFFPAARWLTTPRLSRRIGQGCRFGARKRRQGIQIPLPLGSASPPTRLGSR